MKEYKKNMKKYVKNMKECEKICQYIGFWHSNMYIGLGTWKNFEHRLHIASGTWKNSEFSPLTFFVVIINSCNFQAGFSYELEW